MIVARARCPDAVRRHQPGKPLIPNVRVR
jgi:hypothetical protein